MTPTFAIPGCNVHYDRCKLHHVIWWRHGGRTDLDNLLALCERHHHHKIHDSAGNFPSDPTDNSPSVTPTAPSHPTDHPADAPPE